MFGEIVAHLCASFGWTIDSVESMLDAPRLRQLTQYLTKNPPAHLLVKWFIGLDTESLAPAAKPKTEEERLDSFVQAFHQLGGTVQ